MAAANNSKASNTDFIKHSTLSIIKSKPKLESKFKKINSSLYAQYRRGILANLTWCIGKNIILTPTKVNQK